MGRFALATDTSPEVERALIEGYRRMTPAQRLERVWALNRAADQLSLAGICARHPGISELEARARLAALKLGRVAVVRAIGWCPEDL